MISGKVGDRKRGRNWRSIECNLVTSIGTRRRRFPGTGTAGRGPRSALTLGAMPIHTLCIHAPSPPRVLQCHWSRSRHATAENGP